VSFFSWAKRRLATENKTVKAIEILLVI
jgi:hypothetical protein